MAAIDSIIKPNTGNSTTVRFCHEASVLRRLNRDVSFQFVLSNMSTASLGEDFYISSDTSVNLTIPYGFRGQYSSCIDLVIAGDDSIEDEIIAYTLEPLSTLDSVQLPNESDGYLMLIISGKVLLL